MKKVMLMTAAVALAFGLSPFANAQGVPSVPPSGKHDPKTINIDDSFNYKKDVKIDIDKTKTIWKGQADNDGAFGASANNHSTAYTSLDVDIKDSFNQTKIINVTKLDGYVSHNNVHDIGNRGGDAYTYSPGGYGGDGYAKAKAYSGDAYGGDGGKGGKARSGDGGYAYGGDGGKAKGGHGGYAEGGDGGYSSASRNGNGGNGDANANGGNGGNANGNATAQRGGDGGYAKGGDGGYAKGERSGDATGGRGGDGGRAESGYAASQNQHSGNGGNGARGGDATGGSAGTFNASNTLSGLTGAAGVTVALQNTGIAALQQVGVTTMANVTVGH